MQKIFIIFFILRLDLSKSEMKPFIVKGEYAKKKDFPYAAFLCIDCTDEWETNSYICGSSIINQRITLTAGHCVECNGAKITVTVGSADVMKGTTTTAQRFILHEHYSEITLENDIALVKLKKPLTFNEKIGRVALMPRPPYHEEALIAGWGVVDEESVKMTNVLKFTRQYIWPENDCLKILHRVTEGTLCARSKNANSFAAVGDSGSALVVKNYIQVGLVSCKDPKYSTSVVIYTDIGYFYDWILENVEKLMCEN